MKPSLGPTGKFPEGKLNPFDDGGLRFAVSTEKGVVRVDFQTPVSWLGLPPQIAIAFANILKIRAEELLSKES